MGLEFIKVINISRNSKHKNDVADLLKSYNIERGHQASDIAILITKKESFFKNETKLKEYLIEKSKERANGLNTEYKPGDENFSFDHLTNGGNPANNDNNLEEWSARQAYIHLGYMMLAAKTLKIDSTPIEGFEPKLNDYLTEHKLIDSDERVTLVLLLGYTKDVKNVFIGEKQMRKNHSLYIEFK